MHSYLFNLVLIKLYMAIKNSETQYIERQTTIKW